MSFFKLALFVVLNNGFTLYSRRKPTSEVNLQQRPSLTPEATTTQWSNIMSKSKNDDVTITFDTAPPTPGVEGETIVQYDEQGKFKEAHSYGNFVEKIEGGEGHSP